IEHATTRLDARIEECPRAPHALAHHGRVRIHAGTAEVLARVVRLDSPADLSPRNAGWAQLVLRKPIGALRGDRFIVRDETARWTLGGGVVVNPLAERHRRTESGLVATLERLHGGTDADAVATFLEVAPDFAVDVATLSQALGMRIERAAEVVHGMHDVLLIEDVFGGPGAAAIAPGKWERFAAFALDAVSAQHRAEPLAPGLEMESLRRRLPWAVTPRVFRWGIERLVGAGRLVREEQVVRLPSHRVSLDAAARERAARLEGLLADGGLMPPDLRQLGERTGLSARELLEVLTVLDREGRVVRIASDLFYAKGAADEARARLEAHCRTHGETPAAAFRDAIGASRKFAIAFLDWTDRTGVTLRVGDARRLRR